MPSRLAHIARESLPQDKVVQLETCVGRVKRCHEHLTQMSDSAFGVGQYGLITAPSNDECGDLMPFARANSVVSPTTLPNAPSSLTGFACISVRETWRAKKAG
jgi:hypothetical protein